MRTVPLLAPLDDTGLHHTQPASLCRHSPHCPAADSADREAARVVAGHPGQGWSLLCNGVLAFEVMSISDAEEAADQVHYEPDVSSSSDGRARMHGSLILEAMRSDPTRSVLQSLSGPHVIR